MESAILHDRMTRSSKKTYRSGFKSVSGKSKVNFEIFQPLIDDSPIHNSRLWIVNRKIAATMDKGICNITWLSDQKFKNQFLMLSKWNICPGGMSFSFFLSLLLHSNDHNIVAIKVITIKKWSVDEIYMNITKKCHISLYSIRTCIISSLE